MRKTFYILMLAASGILALTSCTDKEVEARLARLEGRIAELESKSGNTRTPISTPMENTTTPTTGSVVDEIPTGPLPRFDFEEETFDFGNITEGVVAEHTFRFKNVGEAPLIISSATASCGCTVPSWPREPIPVGGTGEILVKFDSKGKPGVQNKTVTITANTAEKISRLNIKSTVSPAASGGPVK